MCRESTRAYFRGVLEVSERNRNEEDRMSLRKLGASRRWPLVMVVAMFFSGVGPAFLPQTTVSAQTAPVGQGFIVNADDLRFIFAQILVAQDHAAGGVLQGVGAGIGTTGKILPDPQLPSGLRTVDGSYNNLVPSPDQHLFGAADQLFPRMLTPRFRDAQPDPATGLPTSYKQNAGNVFDSEPRLISNLIVDQSANNPAAQAAHDHPCGSGGFVCQPAAPADPADPTNSLFIPNITPDFGLSAPFNLMFTFFGQFFDHGLDLVPKSGGTVIIPLQLDDPLFVPGSPTNFMVMTRGALQPGPDGILGTADDVKESINQTTPWVDQNQTYTSHPAHQVFLRQYVMVGGRPLPDGKVLDGDHCGDRGTGITGDLICNIGNWAQVKAQAAQKLGIQLVDTDVLDVPLILTDPYGHFKPGLHGFPQLVRPGPTPTTPILVEGDPTANGGKGVLVPADAFRTGHAFLNDIAHNAVPVDANGKPLPPDTDTTICDFRQVPSCQQPGTYDDELLNAHFITGDGRGNENIGLTTVHNIFHAEHNRFVSEFDRNINLPVDPTTGKNSFGLTQPEIDAWHAVHPGSGWGYGERLFQAARFGTEMEYQHLVFEEFARTLQPLINPFLGSLTSINPAISAEFAHTVYRLGHSMLPEILHREIANPDGTTTTVPIRLFNAFLNPESYNLAPGDPAPTNGTSNGSLTAPQAAGTLINGLVKQVGNELDEFVTSSVRNSLVGLPLDLPAINIARGRSEGIPGLNDARRQLFGLTKNSALTPYQHWFDFGQGLRHHESLVNFIAAYATHPLVASKTTVADRRAGANLLLSNQSFMFAATPAQAAAAGCPDASCGLENIDFWVGGLAERPNPFGGLLGSTFNYIFEKQLEDLQNGDRFYYLQRTDGLNFRFSLEGNSFAELIRRNTVATDAMGVVFKTADFIFNPNSPDGVLDPTNPNSPVLQTLPDGTKQFFDPLHTGKNILFVGGAGDDRFLADIGDDTLYGNAGNDRLSGGDGADTIVGGDGDDILFGGNGDDVLKGGPGDDAISSGPGFGADLVMGGDGNDFLLGGDDGVEYFAGPGDDVIVDGAMRAEAILGGPGDDWIYDGDGHDGGIFGDNGNLFDLLAGLDPVGGDDVLGGGPGQDNHFGEGGNDIMLMSEGTNKFFGDFGFDWITLRGWLKPEFIELDLLAAPNVPLNFNDLRNRYRYVDGASGWDMNDHIAGSLNRLCDPTVELLPVECLIPGMELTAGTPPVQVPAKGVPGEVNFRGGSGAAKIAGLTELMTAFGVDLNSPAVVANGRQVKGVGFMGGDILLGGKGSDTLEGKRGDDLIDGDVWLNVQLRAVLNPGFTFPAASACNPGATPTNIGLCDDPRDLVAYVFADPQQLNPGNISIVRSIVTPPPVKPDCGAVLPLNCDTAVYNFNREEYDINLLPNGIVQVFHDPAKIKGAHLDEGTDLLRNIEQLQFADVLMPVPKPLNTVPAVVGLTQAAATTLILQAGLRVGTVTFVNSTTAHIGTVVDSSPTPGNQLPANSPVDLIVSLGTIVPTVTGVPLGQTFTPGTAENIIIEAGMVIGVITQQSSTTVPAGTVISQDPATGLTVDVGTAMNMVVSSGRPPVTVPNVVGLTQAAAATSLTGAGLTVGAITFSPSTTVAAGSVISQTPTAGSSAAGGSAVALVISQGTAPTIATFVSRNATSPNTTITSPAFAVAANTLVVAFISADGPATTPATPAGSRQNVNSMNNNASLPNLTWTRAAQSNAQAGTAEIWYAFAPTAHATMTVTAAMRFSGVASLTVVGFTGAANTLAGTATAITSNAPGSATQPGATLTTTRANSWVFGVGTDWDNPRMVTVGANATLVNQSSPTAITDTYWTERTTLPVPLAGVPTTVSATGTATDRWNFAAVEIRQP
jgi:beta-lactam-binding protein with PASTA domain